MATIEDGLHSSGLLMSVAPLAGVRDEAAENAILWARGYLNAHPEILRQTKDCVAANITADVDTGCNLLAHLTKVITDFATHSAPPTTPGHAGRPSAPMAYDLGRTKGIRHDVTKFCFWLAMTLVFIETQPTMGSPYWTTVYENVINMASNAAQTAPTQEARVDMEDTRNKMERWRTIMYIFPTFAEFNRAMQYDPDFKELLSDLCTAHQRLAETMFDLREEATSDNEFENCWIRKKGQVETDSVGSGSTFQSSRLGGNSRFGIPTTPEFLIATLAISLLFRREANDSTMCPTNWPGNLPGIPTDWQCSNSNHDQSVCILTCLNPPHNAIVRKIVWGLSNVRACDGGKWKPEDPNMLSKCAQIRAADYEYGITRMTPEY